MRHKIITYAEVIVLNVLMFSFNAIAPMLFLTALGWFISKQKHLDEHSLVLLNRICFRYLLPALVFHNTLAIDFHEYFNPHMVLFCAAGIFALMIASWFVFSKIIKIKNRERRCTFIVASYRSNNVIYAFTLAMGMFGEAGARTASMLIPITIILYNLLTVIAMVHFAQDGIGHSIGAEIRRALAEIIRNPMIIGSVLAITLSLMRVSLPHFLNVSIANVAVAATPVALIMLGAHLDLKMISGNLRQVLAVCVMRLMIVPAVMVPLAIWAGFRGPELGALMVVFSAPSAVANLVMARNYNVDAKFMAQTVILSTVLSMPTMFIIISILRATSLI